MTCFAHPMDVSRPIELLVSLNGVDYSKSGQQILYHPPLEIHEVMPPFAGASTLTVRGANFQPSPELSCIFSNSQDSIKIATAIFKSESLIQCVVPYSDLRDTTLEVSSSKEQNADNPIVPFKYKSTAEVYAVVPMVGPASGGTLLTVSVDDLDSSQNGLVCSFRPLGENHTKFVLTTHASILSSKRVKCRTPVISDHPSRIFSVSLGSVYGNVLYDMGYTGTEWNSFSFHADIEISEVSPQILSPAIETELHVFGANFMNASSLICIFNDFVKVSANFHSSGHLVCTVPIIFEAFDNSDPDDLLLRVSNNGVDYSMSNLKLQYAIPISIESVAPRYVSEVGGSTISIVSTDFEVTESLFCVFTEQNLWKGLESGRTQASFVTKRLVYTDGREIDSASVACNSPKLSPGIYFLSLESNSSIQGGINFSEVAKITVFQDFSLLGFSPISGPSSGGTTLKIYGSNIPNTTELCCKVGTTLTLATYISSDILSCSTPTFEVGMYDEEVSSSFPFNVGLSVSANGQEFAVVEGLFSYILRPHVSEVVPASGAFNGGTDLIIVGRIHQFQWCYCEWIISE